MPVNGVELLLIALAWPTGTMKPLASTDATVTFLTERRLAQLPRDTAHRTRGEKQRGHCLQRVLLWLDRTFTDPRLCAASVDRLTFAGNILQTGTDSYRPAQTRARAQQAS